MPPSPRPGSADSNDLKVARYVTLARRALRHWPLAVLVFAVAVTISVGIAMTRTRYYKSEALIYFKEELRKDMLSEREPAGGERDLAHKLHQLLWSRTRLITIIKALDLYPDMRKEKTEEEVVEYMRNAIEVREKGGDTFWVSFEYRDPKTAQVVTQRLADTFIEENAKEAVDRSRMTFEFLLAESAKARKELDQATTELSRLYEQHPELVPAAGTDVRAPGAAAAAIGKAARAMPRRARYIMKGASPELRAMLVEKGRLEAQLAISQNQQRAPTEREQDLAEARRQLSSLRARFSDDYPDVVAARARVARLQGPGGGEARGDPEATRLRAEIGRLDAEIVRLTPKAQKVDDGEGAKPKDRPAEVDTGERLETEYNRLVQAFEVAKARNAALADTQLKARVQSNMEAQQQRATFRIVDPAYLPEKVVRPSRRKIVMLGAVLGILLALAAAGGRVLLDPRVYDETDLTGLNLPILAQVPHESRRAKA